MNRRRFMTLVGAAGAGLAGSALVACTGTEDHAPTATARAKQSGNSGVGPSPTAHGGSATHAAATPTEVVDTPSGMTADEMDAHHHDVVARFPEKTSAMGNQPLKPRIENGVKVYDITCSEIQWETVGGTVKTAWAYNEMVPGPEIRVTEGDTVRVNVTNLLVESTSVHWHGLIVPFNMDGVPGITQDPIKPGQTFTYEFTVREGNAGTHMYHSHHNSAYQVSMGLLGAFIVEPKDPSSRPAFDKEYSIVLNDGPLGFTFNGKEFPATEPLVAKKGEKVLVRYLHEGSMLHPMHLHGLPQLVIARDGWLLPQPYMCDTVNIAPGERWEVIVDCTELGVWAFHCHILPHAEGPNGMFGMVTVLIVDE
jgi:FtsP/CotA-like multicopper oxidase with cupredoxin domain